MNRIEKLTQAIFLKLKFKNFSISNFKKFFFKTLLGFLFIFIVFIIAIYNGFFGRVPTNKEVQLFQNMKASEVYSADSVLLYRFDKENRINITFDSLPKYLIQALVATEDARFYEHKGVDLKSILRVAVKTIILQDKSSGGGSTISQQLVKNYYPRKKYWIFSTPINKFEELVAAYKLESHFSKNKLLEFYFNTVPFGQSAFGIESASQRFFSTSTSKLSIEQAAVLVGMLKATYTYNPLKFQEASKKRRNVVLNLMEINKFITSRQCDSLQNLPLKTHKKAIPHFQSKAHYFTEFVRLQLQDWLANNKKPSGKPYDLYKDGLKIYTTLNYQMQQYAEQAVTKRMKNLQREFDYEWRNEDPWNTLPVVLDNAIKSTQRYKQLKASGLSETAIMEKFNTPIQTKIFTYDSIQSALISPLDSVRHSLKLLQAGFVAIEPKTGYIKAYVGGIDEKYFQYDHVTTKRQVGSTFKPFVYAAAIENGVLPCNLYPNDLIKYPQYEDWEPRNSDEIYGGQFTVWGALAASVNTVCVQLMQQVGLPKIIDLAQKMGVETPLPEVPSLVLGSAELSLLEMARAYTAFPNYGKPIYEVAVINITNRFGARLTTFPKKETKQVYSTKTAYIMVEMLKRVVLNGISAPLRYDFKLFTDLGGKTGTSQAQADGWFIGFSPNLVFGSWVGAENPAIHFKNMQYGQAAHSALPIDGEFLKLLQSDPKFNFYLKAKFEKPSKEITALFNCPSRKNVPRRIKDTLNVVSKDTLTIGE